MARTPQEIESKFDLLMSKVEDGSPVRRALKDEGVYNDEFYKWIDESEEKKERYARAREQRTEKIFDEMLDIADDGSNDYMTITKGDITYNVIDQEAIQRSRLRIDARKWVLAKMAPNKYGDKLDLTSKGDKITAPIIGMQIVNESDTDKV